MSPSPRQMTQLLREARDGDSAARDSLLSAIYDDLRELARAYFRRERPGHTLEPTAVVNEVCIRLLASDSLPGENRTQFRAYVAKAMRNVLIDHARERGRQKRGGEHRRIALQTDVIARDKPAIDLLDLESALQGLAEIDERKARVVELRYFGGLTNEEVAAHLGVSLVTVKRDWEIARTWLRAELG